MNSSSSSSPNLQTVLEHKCVLGEGPVWSVETQTIYWLDITQNLIHSFDINQQKHSSFNVGEMVGCIAFREKGGLIAGLQNGIAFIDFENNKVEQRGHWVRASPHNGLKDWDGDLLRLSP